MTNTFSPILEFLVRYFRILITVYRKIYLEYIYGKARAKDMRCELKILLEGLECYKYTQMKAYDITKNR